MGKNTILFDLDGTLLNTLDDLAESVNAALASFDLPSRSKQQVRRALGRGIRYLMSRSVPDGEANPAFEAVFAAFRAHYNAHCRDKTRPYDGIPELLEKLLRQGWRMALVSNKVDSAVQILYHDFFSTSLSLAVGQREGIPTKPDPAMPRFALEALGARPEEAVYIGDSEVDYETARNAGLACVLVSWGFRDREELEALGPEGLCDAPEALPEILSAL